MVSIANLHFLPVKTQTTLKSPLEGHNLGPFHKPEEFLGRAMDNLTHEDWETNVNGIESRNSNKRLWKYLSKLHQVLA